MEERTFYASARRDPQKAVIIDYQTIADNEYLNHIFNAISDIAAILNEHRQIIFANRSLVGFLQKIDQNELLGLRPGEAMNCVNATLNPAGCGTSPNCRYCGAVNAILESQRNREKIVKECRITTKVEDESDFLDLKVTATPFLHNGKTYTILAIEDISNQKRRQILERVFFHDILNLAGSIKGFADVLKTNSTHPDEYEAEEVFEYVDIMGKLSNELIEEIVSQRTLISAESGELKVNTTTLSSETILRQAISYLSLNGFSEHKEMRIDPASEDIHFESDPTLLKRVLLNMLKNALEASFIDQAITLKSVKVKNGVEFSIHNESVMTDEVKAQVFQRSFSTKGADRGIGTYSIKLLTERYLLGSVRVESDEGAGTTFFVELPC